MCGKIRMPADLGQVLCVQIKVQEWLLPAICSFPSAVYSLGLLCGFYLTATKARPGTRCRRGHESCVHDRPEWDSAGA